LIIGKKNTKYYITTKKFVNLGIALVQNHEELTPDPDDLHNIGFYVTNSDGDGNAKTNEESDLLCKVGFTADQDIYGSFSLESSIYSYVVVPCTFHAGLTGKYQIELYVNEEDMKHVQFTREHVELKVEDLEEEVDPILRAINEKFAKYTKECIELVLLTESAQHAPEHVVIAGRNLLTSSAQLKSSLIGWVNNEDPEWYLEQKAWEDAYEEQYYDEEYYDDTESQQPKSIPPPPPVNFSLPPKLKMMDTNNKSNLTEEQLAELENRTFTSDNSMLELELNSKMKSLRGTKQTEEKKEVVDELLLEIRSGLANLKPASQRKIVLKPLIKDPTICAFNIIDQIMNRRAAIEGDDEDEWSDDDNAGWSDDEED